MSIMEKPKGEETAYYKSLPSAKKQPANKKQVDSLGADKGKVTGNLGAGSGSSSMLGGSGGSGGSGGGGGGSGSGSGGSGGSGGIGGSGGSGSSGNLQPVDAKDDGIIELQDAKEDLKELETGKSGLAALLQ